MFRSLHGTALALALLLGRGEGAEDLGDAVDDVLLLLGGEALLHLLDDGVEGGDAGGAQVQDHDELALGELVGAQPPDQPRDGRARVAERQRLLAQRAGERLEVLQQLDKREPRR